MRRSQKYRFNYCGYDVTKLKLVGQGHEGKVYLLPDDKVLKVFHNPDSCARQVEILIKAQKNRFFPSVFDFDSYSIVMSFVYGSTLSYYLKKNEIDKHLSLELVKLINSLRKLHFTKLDIRLGHIYIQPDNTVKVIDPRGSYDINLPYPRSMLHGLEKRRSLKKFFDYIKHDYPEHYKYWKKMMSKDSRH